MDTQNTRSHSNWDLLDSPGDAMKFCYQCGLEIEYSLEIGDEDFCGEGCYREMLENQKRRQIEAEIGAAWRTAMLCGFEEEGK